MRAVDPYLRRVAVCHRAELAAFVPWFVEDRRCGRLHRDRVAIASTTPTPFARQGEHLLLTGADFAARSRGLAMLVERLVAAGELPPAVGEPYAVGHDPMAPLAQVDRVAVTWLGVPASGVHLNGWVRVDGGIAMWVARRARGKRTYPGHLDNVVAGGRSLGHDAATTLRKECQEEAGIPAALAARAVPAGELNYEQQDGRSLKVDTLACYDLELPRDFVPQPVDGEVEAFEAWPLAVVAASLRGDDVWKPNSALVAIDFLLRRGALVDELGLAGCELLAQALRPGDA